MIVSYFGFKVFTLRVFFFWANIYLPSIKFMRKKRDVSQAFIKTLKTPKKSCPI